MKKTFKWMFAAILICGLTFSSCRKDPQTPDPEPTTRTVLAGMTAIGVSVYDSVTYSYEYDNQYRIVRSKAIHTPSGNVLQDLQFTYTVGHIRVASPAKDELQTYECTLDSQGRITHMDETTVLSDTSTMIRHYDFTYDAEGRMVSSFEITEDVSSNGLTQNYVWEGEEIRSISASEDAMVLDFETSDAPAQAMFNVIGYDSSLSELCTQGCFGKLPAHMPSKRTMTITLPLPGMPPYVYTNNYTYTLNAEGRLATIKDTNDSSNETATYTLIWEER